MYKMTTIELIRKTLKLTQRELANELGISMSTISYYESRARAPSFSTLKKIMKLLAKNKDKLNITIEQIFNDYKI